MAEPKLQRRAANEGAAGPARPPPKVFSIFERKPSGATLAAAPPRDSKANGSGGGIVGASKDHVESGGIGRKGKGKIKDVMHRKTAKQPNDEKTSCHPFLLPRNANLAHKAPGVDAQSSPTDSTSKPITIDLTMSPPPKRAIKTFAELDAERRAKAKRKRSADAVEAPFPGPGEVHSGLEANRWERRRGAVALGGGCPRRTIKGKEREQSIGLALDSINADGCPHWHSQVPAPPTGADLARVTCQRIELRDLDSILPPVLGPYDHPLLRRMLAPFRTPDLDGSSPVLRRPPQRREGCQLWTAIYGPVRAEEVLGAESSQSARYLKAWLQEVEVRGPETMDVVQADPEDGRPAPSSQPRGTKRLAPSNVGWQSKRIKPSASTERQIARRVVRRVKRRARSEESDESDLDGFIVDDEEEDELVNWDWDRDPFAPPDELDLAHTTASAGATAEASARPPPARKRPNVLESPPLSPVLSDSRAGVLPQCTAQPGLLETEPTIFPSLTNLIVLHGPSGSGKTASVYAVAQELGWDVFEVNPGGLRSRREVERLVGDVCRNHTLTGGSEALGGGVKSPRKKRAGNVELVDWFTNSTARSKPRSVRRPDNDVIMLDDGDETQADDGSPIYDSSRPTAPTALGERTTSDRCASTPGPQDQAPNPDVPSHTATGGVRQSVVLLEEVDIIYPQDKDFWQGVVELVASSLRPVVLTCNDLTQVPLDTLPIQRVLKYSPPSSDVAGAFLRTVAFCEGHLVDEDSARAAFRFSNPRYPPAEAPPSTQATKPLPRASQPEPQPDLRRAMLQLQFALQWAVGSADGGLDWLDLEPGKESRATFSRGALLEPAGPDEDGRTLVEDASWGEGQVDADAAAAEGCRGGLLEKTWSACDALSFADAHVDRRVPYHHEVFECDIGFAENDAFAAFGLTLLVEDKRPQLPVLPVYARDRKMAIDILRLGQRRAPWFPLLMSRGDEDIYNKRAKNLAHMESFTEFLPIAAPILPRASVVVDYAPYIRHIVAADDEREAAFTAAKRALAQSETEAAAPTSTVRAGSRRSARLNGPVFQRHLDLDRPDQAELFALIRSSGLLCKTEPN